VLLDEPEPMSEDWSRPLTGFGERRIVCTQRKLATAHDPKLYLPRCHQPLQEAVTAAAAASNVANNPRRLPSESSAR
jgi:hypothetical protein